MDLVPLLQNKHFTVYFSLPEWPILPILLKATPSILQWHLLLILAIRLILLLLLLRLVPQSLKGKEKNNNSFQYKAASPLEQILNQEIISTFVEKFIKEKDVHTPGIELERSPFQRWLCESDPDSPNPAWDLDQAIVPLLPLCHISQCGFSHVSFTNIHIFKCKDQNQALDLDIVLLVSRHISHIFNSLWEAAKYYLADFFPGK